MNRYNSIKKGGGNMLLDDKIQPTFIKAQVKNSIKLFRRWGNFRIIHANGEIKTVSHQGYERAYQRTDK